MEKKKQEDNHIDSLAPARKFAAVEREICEIDENEIDDEDILHNESYRLLRMDQIQIGCCSTCKMKEGGESFAQFLMDSDEGKKIGKQNIQNLLTQWKQSKTIF